MKKAFTKRYDNWLEGYLSEGNPSERYTYLEEGLEADNSDENKFRLELFKHRYANKDGELTGADKFMAAWMNLKDIKRISKQFLGAKRAAKEASEVADMLLLTADFTDWQKAILREEHKQLINHYVSLCQNDRTYTSHILGFMNMKEEQLVDKLKNDVYQIAVETPKIVEMSDVFDPISNIVRNMM